MPVMPIAAVELLGALHRVLARSWRRRRRGSRSAPRPPSARAAPPSARRRCAGGRRCPRARSRGRPRGPRRAPSAGSRAGSLEPSGWWTFSPAWSPSVASCSRAAGRWTSVETSSGWCPRVRQPAGELGRGGGLARALQAGHQHDRGRPRRGLERGGSSPPRSATISSRTTRMTAWSGVRLFRTSWPVARARTRSRNCFDDLEVDVGFEQRQADLAQRGVDVGLREDPGRGGTGRPLELLAERFEHESPPRAGALGPGTQPSSHRIG